MSVRVGDRSEGKLQVLRASKDLCAYTLQVCKNEKVFPKSQRWIMTQRIVNESLDVMTCIRRANTARLDQSDEKKYRYEQQMEARCHIDALLSLIDLAYQSFGIETYRVEHWVKLADETMRLLQGWIKSER